MNKSFWLSIQRNVPYEIIVDLRKRKITIHTRHLVTAVLGLVIFEEMLLLPLADETVKCPTSLYPFARWLVGDELFTQSLYLLGHDE